MLALNQTGCESNGVMKNQTLQEKFDTALKAQSTRIAAENAETIRINRRVNELVKAGMPRILAYCEAAHPTISCTCHLETSGPVPNYCAKHDGNYSSFLALHNCD
jgi:hypothetical protein